MGAGDWGLGTGDWGLGAGGGTKYGVLCAELGVLGMAYGRRNAFVVLEFTLSGPSHRFKASVGRLQFIDWLAAQPP